MLPFSSLRANRKQANQIGIQDDIREFKITTTATVTGTSLNKGLMNRRMAVHVRYNFLYISLPSSAKQQRQMTNSALSEERELRRLIYYFKFIAVSQIQFRDSFDGDKQSKWLKSIPRFVGEI